METHKEIEEALIKAMDLLSGEAGSSQDLWHPDFGWLLINGKPTNKFESFLKKYGA